ETEGDADRACAVARRGLELAPDDAELHAILARASAKSGGTERVVTTYAELALRHPEVALCAWYPAVSRSESAVSAVSAKQHARASFRAAEAGFARCRSLDARHDRACREYE